MNYYSENNPEAAAWLRELRDAGAIPYGIIDERSIEDVTPSDLAGFTQCHFFAGIGGWPLALQIAGVPSTTRLWTGSCPCQPFSQAGEGAGFADQRHLWPVWYWLISECQPSILLGEQVAGAAVGPWIDLVFDDLEGMGYACAATAFPSASVGAPHIRQRTYWAGLADAYNTRLEGRREPGRGRGIELPAWPSSLANGMEHAGSIGRQVALLQSGNGVQTFEQRQANVNGSVGASDSPGATNGFWRDADWLACRDEKWRCVEPGTFPLAHGLPARVGRLRGYGNAINPWQAAEFIKAVM